MKYKTLFRLGLKLLGVMFMFEGAAAVIGGAAYLLVSMPAWVAYGSAYDAPYPAAWLISGVAVGAAGIYLFFGGEWVLNRMIPGNRPYCPECGYDLSGNAGPRCSECGTPLPSAVGNRSSDGQTPSA